MDSIYLDTDIILDLLCRREPFYSPAALLFSKVERNEIRAFVSPLSFANLFYILRKYGSSSVAVDALQKLRQLVTVLPVTEKIIDAALVSGFTDFEDAIQYHTALENSVPYLITRNKKHYRRVSITICTAEEFLSYV